MKYQLIVLKFEDNVSYDKEMEDYRKEVGMGMFRDNSRPYPSREKVARALDVFVEEDEFEAIKKGVLETFK